MRGSGNVKMRGKKLLLYPCMCCCAVNIKDREQTRQTKRDIKATLNLNPKHYKNLMDEHDSPI